MLKFPCRLYCIKIRHYDIIAKGRGGSMNKILIKNEFFIKILLNFKKKCDNV